MAYRIPTVTIDHLREFHATHFPHAALPEIYLRGAEAQMGHGDYACEAEDLGYYEDGIPRTLTDEQIAMFRHTEVQTILRKRRRRREEGLPMDSHSAPPSSLPTLEQSAKEGGLATDTLASGPVASVSTTSEANHNQSDETEKPKRRWIALGEKSKARNAKNRKKNRQNHRARKREERKKEQETHENEESDEWDPWHQAKGPDVQKDTTVDLDY